LALAGFDLEKVMGTLPGVLNLATNADVELATATTMATKTLGAFGLKSKDTATTVQNLTRVNDVFSRTVSSASIDMEQLFEVMKFGGPPAKAAGQSIETFAAVAGVLADSAIDASVAGTSLRSMFINLAAPVPKAAKLLKKMKIEVKDGDKNFRDFFDIMKDVERATKKMGNAQRLATLNTLFGKRAVNAANVMLEKGSVELDKYRKKLQNASGSAAKMAKTIRTSIEGRLKRLKSALVEVGFKFIEAFNKGAGDSIESAIKAISEFDVKPVVAELKKIIAFVKDATKFVDDHRFAIKLVIGAWIGYKVKLKAIMALEAVAFFKDIAVALHGGAQGATAMAKGLSILKTIGGGLLAAITSVTAVFAALGAVVAIVATDFENVTLGLAEGFARLERIILKLSISAVGAFKSIVNAMRPVLEAVGLGGAIGVGFGVADDLTAMYTKRIEALDVAIKDMEIASLSTNLQEQGIAVVGDQNVRGLGLTTPKAPPSIASQRLGAAQFNPLIRQPTAPPAPPPRAPNRSTAEAHRATVDVNFSNGTTAKVKSQSPGLSVSQEGLGSQ
jgi:TP901 family phage tail tape measure protein